MPETTVAVSTRATRLTAEHVVEEYGRLIRHRIRQFDVQESEDDCFQRIMLAMLIPSEKLGTSYLDRFDPSRGSAKSYVVMFCMQQMMKLHAREKTRRAMMHGDLLELQIVDDVFGDSGSQEHVVKESSLPDPSWSWPATESTIRTPDDLRAFLAGTKHVVVSSFSPSGEPRSTVYMLELLIWGGFTVPEIASRLGITAVEVYRRFKLLKRDPKIQMLLEDKISA